MNLNKAVDLYEICPTPNECVYPNCKCEKAMKENSAHSFTEGHQLSEEEKKPKKLIRKLRLAEAEKERDEFAIEFATWAMDHAKWSDYVLHNGMVTLLEQFKQQKKMIIIPDRTSKTNAIITRAMTFVSEDVDTPTGKEVFEALSSLIDNVHSEDEILDAVKAEWKKEFGNLQDGTERDCYFVCGLISEALKNLK